MMNKQCGHPMGTHCGCEEGECLDKPNVEEPQSEQEQESSAPPEPAEEKTDAVKEEPDAEPKPEETDVLQGFFIELTEEGEVRRRFYGKQQNITYMLGLVSFMTMEIEQRQRLQRGFLPSAELTATAGLARSMGNIGNVLIQVQGTLSSMNNLIQAIPDEISRRLTDVESSMDAESEQE